METVCWEYYKSYTWSISDGDLIGRIIVWWGSEMHYLRDSNSRLTDTYVVHSTILWYVVSKHTSPPTQMHKHSISYRRISRSVFIINFSFNGPRIQYFDCEQLVHTVNHKRKDTTLPSIVPLLAHLTTTLDLLLLLCDITKWLGCLFGFNSSIPCLVACCCCVSSTLPPRLATSTYPSRVSRVPYTTRRSIRNRQEPYTHIYSAPFLVLLLLSIPTQHHAGRSIFNNKNKDRSNEMLT